MVRGRAGAGMIHRIGFRVASDDGARLLGQAPGGGGPESVRGWLPSFEDPEGLAFELLDAQSEDEPLVARHPEVPESSPCRGSPACAHLPAGGAKPRFLSQTLGFANGDGLGTSRGASSRGSFYVYDEAPERGDSAAPEPCITSPGPRRWRTTTAGGSG